jgi:hypothetical protein
MALIDSIRAEVDSEILAQRNELTLRKVDSALQSLNDRLTNPQERLQQLTDRFWQEIEALQAEQNELNNFRASLVPSEEVQG